MKILITGGKGMLGRTLRAALAEHTLAIADLPETDITEPRSIHAAFAEFRPEAVIHCAAMTAVDKCESEADLAYRVNAIGSANVGVCCHRHHARLLALSTDYVFSGALDRPYHEWDAPGPRTVYGASKLAGEEAIRAHCPDHVIARTAWLYGPGGPSFLHTMLKLGVQAGEPLNVVNDQIGNPTSTAAVAQALKDLLRIPWAGTFHLSCEGEATWYQFAQAIFSARGLKRPVVPCSTAEFPRPAPRPANSRLEKRALRLCNLAPMPHWQESLSRFLREYPQG